MVTGAIISSSRNTIVANSPATALPFTRTDISLPLS